MKKMSNRYEFHVIISVILLGTTWMHVQSLKIPRNDYFKRGINKLPIFRLNVETYFMV